LGPFSDCVDAHARLARVDTTRARAVPGVACVLTGADLATRRDMPAVFDAPEALAPGVPVLHEAPPTAGPTFADIILHAGDSPNLCNHFKLRKGDVEQGFAQADHVFEDTFTSPAVQHVPLETHACVAEYRDGRITVTSSTQTPHLVRAQLAELFQVPLHRVQVKVPTLGGGYGAKAYARLEPVAVALARAAGRPVRLHLTLEEEFVTVTKHAARMVLKTGVRADGTIVARQGAAYFNTGAYADIGPRVIKMAAFALAGPHHVPHVWIDTYAIYTNLPPAGAFRGYGIPQGAWASETQLDMIAARLGLDP
jgi:CO/xanthine dehydrogenase Mo-binding subunit